jgi:DNA (cytosine-5)-methyltransferase 1
MADGSRWLDLGQELVVDLFAGGGGASLGIERAYRAPDVAVNHNEIAIAVHRANHPDTEHYTCDVFEVDPLVATQGRPVGVLWASPDCRHHSKAKGGKPRSKRIRGLAWVVVKWARACRPRLIHLENVEEFADWGPLLADGQPCKVRKGSTFRRWVRQLERLGYRVEHRELVAADHGVPTIRKRLYVIARCDGQPIVWPHPSHTKAQWRPAAECIDWSIPACSIFADKAQAHAWARAHGMRGTPKRPLEHATRRRIAKGIWKHVLTAAEPYIVGVGGRMGQSPERSVSTPFQTVTSKADACIAMPVLTEFANASNQRTFDVGEPLRTQVAQVKGGHFALAAATMIQTGYGEREGQAPRALDLCRPLGTVVAGGVKHAVAAAHIVKFRAGSAIDVPLHTVTAGGHMARPAGAAHAMGLATAFFEQAAGGPNSNGSRPRAALEPLSTITSSGSQQQLVTAYLVKFYKSGGQWQDCLAPMHTVPTKDRMGLVQVVNVPADILAPELRERARQVAHFLHEHLPEHFPDAADMVLVGDRVMVDITLRMLVPRELARAQGFPDTYIIDRGLFETAPGSGQFEWRPVTKTDQVRLIGNSVCPGVAEALIRANAADLIDLYRQVAA